MRPASWACWLAAVGLACVPLLVCAARAGAQHFAGETTLFPYTFGCPAGWSAGGADSAPPAREARAR
jgi:hypothetical protein